MGALIVICGRAVSKLGGQDRRWLKVARILSAKYAARIIINRSYFELAQKTELAPPNDWIVSDDSPVKLFAYARHYWAIIKAAYRHKRVHFCGNALEMTPAALLLWVLGKRISFSFNGVSVDYLRRTRQRKAIILLKLMNLVADRIEILNENVREERFFSDKKLFRSPAMYAGPPITSIQTKTSNHIVFAGHLYLLKGISRLASLIYAPSRPPASEFHIYGAPPNDWDEGIRALVERIAAGEKVSMYGHVHEMSDAYDTAAVVLSLQTVSNYPSQVVIEALCHGCAVVLSRTGDSTLFGDIPGLFYFDASNDDGDVWNVIRIASAYAEENAATISSHAQQVFSADQYARLFWEHMNAEI